MPSQKLTPPHGALGEHLSKPSTATHSVPKERPKAVALPVSKPPGKGHKAGRSSKAE